MLGHRCLYGPTQTNLPVSLVSVFNDRLLLFAEHSDHGLLAREPLFFVIRGINCANMACCFVRFQNVFAF